MLAWTQCASFCKGMRMKMQRFWPLQLALVTVVWKQTLNGKSLLRKYKGGDATVTEFNSKLRENLREIGADGRERARGRRADAQPCRSNVRTN